MIRAVCAAVVLSFLCWGNAAPSLQVPSGFAIESVVDQPNYPMFACLDERGRLFVAESSGLDLYQELQQLTRKCRIRVFEDSDRDGRYESAHIFADQLVFPMGLVWRAGKLYVADPPDVITLQDVDGDNRSDRRTTILSGFGHTDNGSLHGLVFGPDGWLYMTLGQPDGYHFTRPDGSIISGKSGGLFRCRSDGSDIEVVCRGFENLVEVVFLSSGEIIGTDNWFSLPSMGVRDALVHLLEGGLYPLQLRDKGTPFLVSGDPLPAISLYPAVALSGLVRYQGAAFPKEMRGHLFSAQFNARKVVRHQLSRTGSTFRSVDADFVTTEDPDFHPSDVLEAADGTLLVIDTGSWYVQHCPTGRIRSAPARGGIYRVRYLQASEDGEATDHALSDAERLAGRLRGLGRAGDKASQPELIPLLRHHAAEVRLAAAEAIAHCGDQGSVSALVEALVSSADRFEEHAIIHALYKIATGTDLLRALNHEDPRVQRAALLLLDQPPHSSLGLGAVLARVQAADAALRQAALESLRKHPEWTEQAAQTVRALLKKSEVRQDETWRALALGFQSDAEVQRFIAAGLGDQTLSVDQRRALLEVVQRTTLPELPRSWIAPLTGILREGPDSLRLQVAQLSRTRPSPELAVVLAELAERNDTTAEVRLEAIRATRSGSTNAFAFLVSLLESRQAAGVRLGAAELLSRMTWPNPTNDPARVLAFIKEDRLVSPATLLPLLLKAEGRGLMAVESFLKSSVVNGWEPDEEAWSLISQRIPLRARAEFDELRASASERLEARRLQLTSYEEDLKGGDSSRGHQLFAAHCASCHRVGQQGGLVGPDLTKIGAVRAGRDLIEALLLPSATFAQGYEPYQIVLKNGDAFSGIRARQIDDSFVLRDATGAELRLSPDQIETVQRLKLSLMPEGLLSALSKSDVRDLFAYLQGLK